jgi:hypothetical protein
MNSTKLANTLALIVGLLSQRAFDELYRLDRTKRLLPEDLAEALDDYSGQVTLPHPRLGTTTFTPLKTVKTYAWTATCGWTAS